VTCVYGWPHMQIIPYRAMSFYKLYSLATNVKQLDPH